jgi:Ca2+/Na+ antiporter
LALRGAEQLQTLDRRYPVEAFASTILSLVLAVPMAASGAALTRNGQGWAPLTAHLGVVFLNLGVLLPAVVLASGSDWAHLGWTRGAWTPVLFPRAAWRIDAPALLILCLLRVPAAVGRLRLDARLTPWLLVGYGAYLLALLWALSGP